VDLLTDDVFVSMPPMPVEYEGRDLVARFCASLFGAGRRFDLVPTRAKCQPAFGAYLRAPDGVSHGVGLYVLTLAGDRICAMTCFENNVLHLSGCGDRCRGDNQPPSDRCSTRSLEFVPPAAAQQRWPPRTPRLPSGRHDRQQPRMSGATTSDPAAANG
jgi:hypothetical protein